MNGKCDILIVCLYVDDLIFTGNNVKMFDDFKKEMAKEFKMTDIGLMSYYLGIEVKQRDDGIFISQEAYAKEVFKNDSDWARDVDDRKSTTGFVFYFGKATFTWTSKKQSIVTLSTCEAEYAAATSTICHAIWLRSLLKELSLIQDESTQIYVDNKLAIALAKNPAFHDRNKHIDTRYHFIRESIAKKQVQVKFVKSEDQDTDIFTKLLNREVFEKLRNRLGIRESIVVAANGSFLIRTCLGDGLTRVIEAAAAAGDRLIASAESDSVNLVRVLADGRVEEAVGVEIGAVGDGGKEGFQVGRVGAVGGVVEQLLYVKFGWGVVKLTRKLRMIRKQKDSPFSCSLCVLGCWVLSLSH
ncbi:hypothetical protein RJ640_005572 [Escallonia rubra]|uniref:Reverse transcriptase Ty1/copia-type domain-containing protein n=1 Tax=Escallonia rubra TaxID=112253 RepID=A0AA88SCA4_9ASTE|nr:hypothetical protein RJ640_005572 [Escallonia rubra]